MEQSFFDIIKPDLILAAVFIGGTIVLMKFMPRLMAGVPFVDPKAVHDMISDGKEILVLDVRTADEFNGDLGHVPGSVNVTGADLDGRLGNAGDAIHGLKGEPIFITCRTENRSPRAARILTKAGFTSVHIIKGGMKAWNKQGLPIEK